MWLLKGENKITEAAAKIIKRDTKIFKIKPVCPFWNIFET